VFVSNHGGRQLDGVASSITATSRIIDAAGGRTDILMEGGVKSSQDVVKTLAYGAPC